jgi:hypothetical protein
MPRRKKTILFLKKNKDNNNRALKVKSKKHIKSNIQSNELVKIKENLNKVKKNLNKVKKKNLKKKYQKRKN